MYEPQTPSRQRVKSRISAESWKRRVEQALASEIVLKKILANVARGTALDAVIAKVLPPSRRSWALRHLAAYREHGFEGLIDSRMPREQTVSKACREVLQAACVANPRLTIKQALVLLQENGIRELPSDSTIKREFARAKDRRKYARRKQAIDGNQRVALEVVDLPFAGGELLLAAEAETGGIAALTMTVRALAEEAHAAAQGQTPVKDTANRDEHGHFTSNYNRQRSSDDGEIPAHLRSAAEKAVGRVPTWPRFVHERDETIDAKLRMLTFGWCVATTKGWDALRTPDAAGLEPMTGFAYMPSTLAKFVSALAISSAGTPMLETVGRHWHEVASKHFEEPGAMAALYIDNHAKEVWSSLFTMSGKVSHLNRVMPCITTTYAHTGAGTPVVLSVQSGSAPLAPRLVALVERAEKVLGGDVERAVVIDSEGSTFDLLESFTKRKRVMITPLRPSRAPNLELHYSPGSYFRPYREHDELRVASCTLRHKSTGRTLELGALLVRREHRDDDTVLLTNGLALGMEGRALADLYFRRWPVQENAFKEAAAAVALNQHRGNCGRMVANVAIVSERDKLQARTQRDGEALTHLTAETATLAAVDAQSSKDARRAQALLATQRRRFDMLVKNKQTAGKALARVAIEQQQALVHAEKTAAKATAARTALDRNQTRVAKVEHKLAEDAKRIEHIEPQLSIRQLDVAQDMILTAAKLTAMQLITFALRLYLPMLPMSAQTFVSRVFSIRGRKEIEATIERVIFYENPRDPQVNAALRDACRRLNERDIQRDGRRLRYAVEETPVVRPFI